MAIKMLLLNQDFLLSYVKFLDNETDLDKKFNILVFKVLL